MKKPQAVRIWGSCSRTYESLNLTPPRSTLNPLEIVENIQATRHSHTRDILLDFKGVAMCMTSYLYGLYYQVEMTEADLALPWV
ncbi:hypothetical protein ARMGADRAFT_1004403 [Armillaria gallica]|uniref:Uncharacterized protein n=1 Tax=Armillaria gallica TaxID=47427 RepID=A0A2H3EM47_ARMGA|nr:hypothetical protein ARMGADRAFT_1004403 [Armillaria gallica]